MNIHTVRFCFSDTWKAPVLRLLNVDDKFTSDREKELEYCFTELNKIIRNIDGSTSKGMNDLYIARNVSYQLRNYKLVLGRASANHVETKISVVPYTSKDKKRGFILWMKKLKV